MPDRVARLRAWIKQLWDEMPVPAGRGWECIKDIRRILSPYRASWIPLPILALVFVLPQSQDAFRALVQDWRVDGEVYSGAVSEWLPLLSSVGAKLLFLVLAWLFCFEVFYWARFMSRLRLPHLMRPFPHFYQPPIITEKRRNHIHFVLPRWLGAAAAIEVVLAVAWANRERGWALLAIALVAVPFAGAVYLTIWRRRDMVLPVLQHVISPRLQAAGPPIRDLDPSKPYQDRALRSRRADRRGTAAGHDTPWARRASIGIVAATLAVLFASSWLPTVYARPLALAMVAAWFVAGVLFIRTADWLPAGTQWWALSGLTLYLLLLALSIDASMIVGVFLSSPSVIMSVAAAWVFIGTLAIVYPAERYALPVAVPILIVACLLSIFTHDNHDVRSTGAPLPNGITLKDSLDKWYAQAEAAAGNERLPLIVVATAGGASRAGLWTGKVLGELEARVPNFHRSVFAVSGVSGGSLGAAAWRAMLDDDIKPVQFPGCAEEMLRQDYLSPVFLTGFYADLMQRILPGRLFPDRAAALEEAWEAGWRVARTSKPCGGEADARPNPGRFGDGFHARRPGEDWRPLLLLNATSEKSGRRIITSELPIEPEKFADAIDFFGETRSEIRYSTAAHNSARFPYIDAAGTVWSGGVKTDRVVDGGYFENFGIATANDLIASLGDLCRPPDTPKACGHFQIFLLQISSDPDIADEDRRNLDWHNPLPGRFNVASDVTAPLVTAYKTRDGLGYRATKAGCRQIGAANYAHFRLTDQSEPMNWSMSAAAVASIGKEWCSKVNRPARVALRRLFPGSLDACGDTPETDPSPAGCFAADPPP